MFSAGERRTSLGSALEVVASLSGQMVAEIQRARSRSRDGGERTRLRLDERARETCVIVDVVATKP